MSDTGKKLLIINSVCGIRSTGRICTDIADEYTSNGYNVKIAYGRECVPSEYEKYAVRIGSEWNVRLNALKARIFDNEGLNAKKETFRFLKWADEFDPDVLWLHNIHGYYINYELLFDWIKQRPDMQVKWTLHDCWAFTGHCSHFSYVGCSKWKTGCHKCPQKTLYPAGRCFDNSVNNYRRKREAFCGVENMTMITPSQWLAELLKESFLNEYSTKVINNTIDTSTFKPTESDIKKRLGLEDKRIVLGVASAWDKRKGLDDFIKLADMLPEEYKIVLVGLSDKQLKKIPKSILGIKRTNSKKELAELYTAADVFLNLTYEDNYPTVNLEAQACGTPVITYDTGGSGESVKRENVVKQGDLTSIIRTLEVMK